MKTNLNKTNHRHSEFISESIRHCERSEAIWLENTRHPEFISGSKSMCHSLTNESEEIRNLNQMPYFAHAQGMTNEYSF